MTLTRIAAILTAILVPTLLVSAQEIEEPELMSYDTLLQRVEQLESEVRMQPAYDTSVQTEYLESELAAQEATLQQLRAELNGECCDVGGWFTSYQSVILKPTLSNSTALIVSNDPNFDHLHFDWNLEHSPRVELGYLSGSDGLGWRARYWHFRHQNAFFANDANGLIPTDEGIVGFFSEDGDIVIGLSDVDAGVFSNAIRVDVADMELEKRANENFSVLAGLRYAQLRQHYFANTDEGLATSSSHFHGVGPTAAIDFQHLITQDIALYSTVRGSLLYGKQSFTAADDVNNLRLNATNADAFASSGEIQLGIRAKLAQALSVNLGLEAQHWADVGGANPTAIYAGEDFSIDSDSPNDDDLGFIGLNFGATLQW